MDLRESLEKILKEWQYEKTQEFTGNQLANHIRGDFKKNIKNLISNEKYLIQSSTGAGGWANIPWLSILDKRITDSTQDGIYPVYGFRADGSGAYLSLNQGTTTPRQLYGTREANERAQKISKYLRSKIPKLKQLNGDPLELRATTTLGKSYEKPNIGSIFYPANEIPSEQKLREDLFLLLEIYEEVVNLMPEIEQLDLDTESINVGNLNLLQSFKDNLENSGLLFSLSMSTRFISALQTKPFLILTGLSGSGKTKLAEAFSSWISESKSQYCMVAVGADWTNREPLLGFPNALDLGKYVMPDSGVLDLILQAGKDSNRPYFLILDEMNMSHVERYFADFLSAMESTDRTISLRPETDDWKSCDVPATIILPENLFIMGTVNIDETTYMFSPKVLDRANVIEFRVSANEMESYFKEPNGLDMDSLRGMGASMGESFVAKAKEKNLIADNLSTKLMPFFDKLQEAGAEFGYRTASEISRFVAICTDIAKNDMSADEVIYAAIMQKLLPKLHGSRNKIEKILKALGSLCLDDPANSAFLLNDDKSDKHPVKYPLSYEKLHRMHNRVVSDGFTSFAEA